MTWQASTNATSATADVVLEIQNLTVNYGTRRVLNSLNLLICAGEIFGLLGPNGAGKTTLIRSICGRTRPSAGEILIDGQSNTRRRSLRRIGLAPQEIGLFDHLTARENLSTFGRLAGLTRRQTADAMALAIEATKIDPYLDEYVHALSGGWKRRVNIAAAILHRPSLLVLDEPSAGVDIDARSALQSVIRDLSRSGISVLVSTHDLGEAHYLCDRVGFLRNGCLSPVGDPQVLLHDEFGEQLEMIVELRKPAGPEATARLLSLGFTKHRRATEWSAMVGADADSHARITSALQACDLSIAETRLREPGLDSLFTRLSAKVNAE